jgi:(p)ppGpp synthase/HD superfamily hydrolase
MNRKEFFNTMAEYLNADELSYVQRMYWLVKEAHRKQSRRLTGERYFEHVRRVAFDVAMTYGYADAMHVALGLGHDIVEDCYVPTSVIVNLFGQEMYEDIIVLSKELPSFNPITGELVARAKRPDDEYYMTLTHADARPRRIKGCDRIDNVTDLSKWEEARRNKYKLETQNWVLPIVRITDLRMAAEIERKLVL